MKCPKTIEEAFDLETEEIRGWEIDLIRKAAAKQDIYISQHAVTAAKEDDVVLEEIIDIVEHGVPVSKDLPDNAQGRATGINFEGQTVDGRTVGVKVGWFEGTGYNIITVYRV